MLKPGGITVHGIDLRDLMDFYNPLEFLKLDSKSWKEQFSDENIHNYTNRWRIRDFKEAFKKVGLTILKLDSQPESAGFSVTKEQKGNFHKDF